MPWVYRVATSLATTPILAPLRCIIHLVSPSRTVTQFTVFPDDELARKCFDLLYLCSLGNGIVQYNAYIAWLRQGLCTLLMPPILLRSCTRWCARLLPPYFWAASGEGDRILRQTLHRTLCRIS
ncbi:hypothetical protein BDN71DRAFT_913088 [Pleurotus eryngii]|uniref:Uncharacterized protein n=1 Tax=Pleurotus eryngii TaxID=5323 RepID=A0A9P5ZXQ0_PLEER|nr:hypothetical protein BDN71DRAFT_913088 [Pleurotus eryngii]